MYLHYISNLYLYLCRYHGERNSKSTLIHVVRVCLCSKELISVTLAISVSEEHLFVPRTKGRSHCLEETTQVSTVLPDEWQEDLRRAWRLLLPCQEQVRQGHLLEAEES